MSAKTTLATAGMVGLGFLGLGCIGLGPAGLGCQRPVEGTGLSSASGARTPVAESPLSASVVTAGSTATAGPTADAPATASSAIASGRPTAQTEPERPPAKKRRYVVAAMGDSLTDPRSQGGKYLTYLKSKCPQSQFDSYGVGGNMVNQMRRRFLRDVFGLNVHNKRALEKPAYSHVLVLGGINDICSDETALRTNDKIKVDLLQMYAWSREHGTKVIAVTVPPWAGFTKYYNPRREESTFELNRWILAQKEAGTVDQTADLYPQMSCGKPTHLCDDYSWVDHVHWNKQGHQKAGQFLHETIFADCL